ncbi:DUF6101 family protein [uncultured Methylobacterium sp.]|uniref:DUF6101 family protein n=1 Tax=uncultured Methylobacterium sp. TaxID=157278 RepID=UPI0035CB66A7
MNTFHTLDRHGGHLGSDGATMAVFSFAASRLPVIGTQVHAAKAAGIALAFATEAAETCGEDRFALLLVDVDGAVLSRLGPFSEEDVVATWRDLAARTGLPRMIVREDGLLATVAAQVGRLMLGKTRIRRRHGSLGARRPRFLVRRKTGRLPARPQIHRGENEIIARS